MRALRLFASSFLVLVAACGGSVSSPGTSDPSTGGTTDGAGTTTPGKPETKPDSRPLAIEGSFDLRFTSVAATPDAGSYTPPTAPPSSTTPFRLDLRRDKGGALSGALTSRWGQVASARVVEGAKSLELTGSFTASGGAGAQGVSDRWLTVTLDRAADGSLAGTFSASGEETIFQGDAGYSLKLAGKGTVAADATRPEARVVATTTLGPPGKLLPWDLLTFQFAEPILHDDAFAASHVAGPGGAALPLAWSGTDGDVTDWAGISSLSARAKTWPSNGGWSAIVEPVKDRVSLVSDRALSALDILPIPGAATTIGFDDDVLRASSWGGVDFLGGGFTGATDPRCEAGGCARLTPPALGSCSSSTAGLLAQLTPGPQGKVQVRYRLLAHPKYPGGTPYIPSAMVVESALEGGEPKREHVYVGTSNGAPLAVLPSAIDQYDWATPWTTFETTLPVGSGRVGFALSAVSDIYCGGPPLPPADVALLVESITAK